MRKARAARRAPSACASAAIAELRTVNTLGVGHIIGKYGVRAVIGKGGMGGKTLAGLKQHGAVYLNAIGGAAQFYAKCIERVDGVSLLEFGTPEAMWHLQLQEFPAIVTMDAHGNSLHKDLEQESAGKLAELAGVRLR